MGINDMKQVMESVAGFMALSARTAPKARGEDYLEIEVITGEKVQQLGDEMKRFGVENGNPHFERDGNNVLSSEAVLLLSLASSDSLGLDCGACGFKSCREKEKAAGEGALFFGPLCVWRVVDLGTALGSAVKTASLFNADNRIMLRIGIVARRMELIEGEVVIGVPITASGKSVYFDR